MYIIEAQRPEGQKTGDYHLAGNDISFRATLFGVAVRDQLHDGDLLDEAPRRKLLTILATGNTIIPAALVPAFNHASEAARKEAQQLVGEAWNLSNAHADPSHPRAEALRSHLDRGAEDDGADPHVIRVNYRGLVSKLVDGEVELALSQDLPLMFGPESYQMDMIHRLQKRHDVNAHVTGVQVTWRPDGTPQPGEHYDVVGVANGGEFTEVYAFPYEP